VVADLWSKALVFRWMEGLEAARSEQLRHSASLGKDYYPIWGEKITFMLSLNPGAAFGQLDQWPFLLVGGRICAGLFLIWLLVRSPKGRPVFNSALVLVLAGALGNLYDNLLRARDLAKDAPTPSASSCRCATSSTCTSAASTGTSRPSTWPTRASRSAAPAGRLRFVRARAGLVALG
jgi:lipoprotein signal peptidase